MKKMAKQQAIQLQKSMKTAKRYLVRRFEWEDLLLRFEQERTVLWRKP